MKKICLSILFAAVAGTGLLAQKTINDPNAEKRNVSGFHAIEVSGGIDLYLSHGTESVAISASKAEDKERIMTRVENGVLKIWFEWKNHNGLRIDWGTRRLRAYVSYKDLDRLEASGGSDIEVDGSINVPKLELEISGGSDFEGKVDIQDLTVDASGGSDVSISGKATRIRIDASGGSDFNGFDLAAETANVDASGGSDVEITVNKELSAEASGGSDVHYKGSGLVRDLKSSGGSVKKVSK